MSPQGTVSYGYDAAGRRTSLGLPGQLAVSYGYDAADRLLQITKGSALVTFGYDAADRRTLLTLPNGVTTEYTYDVASQLTGLTYKKGAATLSALTYAYDPAGNRTQVGGNWARTGLPDPITSASYNAANHQLALGGRTMTYDLAGNLLTLAEPTGTTAFSWDARNQLSALTTPDGTASFLYDGLGRRRAKTINGTRTDYLYDGLTPVQELSGASVTANLLTGLGIDEYFTRTTGTTTRTLLTDVLGSTVALTDDTGAVQAEYTYEPFGATTETGADSNPFQYTGRENDGTGLYYYRARYYHPQLQRFTSEDPIGLAGGFNLYRYAGNNPVRFNDQLGLCQIDVRFSPVTLGGSPTGGYHSYIVTTDPSGSQNYYRGGPTSSTSGEISGGSSSSSSGGSLGGRKDGGSVPSSSPWGPVKVWSGEYRPGTPDWDPGQPLSMQILNNGEPCGPYDQSFAHTAAAIAAGNIAYWPLSTNSNATTTTVLVGASLNPGAPPVWAPGWGTLLLP